MQAPGFCNEPGTSHLKAELRTGDRMATLLRGDLSALELAGVVNIDGFPFRKDIEDLGSALSVSIASRFSAAKRQMNLGANSGSVHVEDAGSGVFHRAIGAIDVPGVNRGRQPILDAVSNVDGFVQATTLDHGYNRAENLFLCDSHVRFDVGKYSWLDEIAMFQIALFKPATTAHKASAVFFLAYFDVAEDLVGRLLVDNRADVGLGVQAVTQPERFGAVNKHSSKFLGDATMDDDAGSGSAPLSRGSECAPQYTLECEIQVRILHDHYYVLAAHLKRAYLVTGGCRLADLPSYF